MKKIPNVRQTVVRIPMPKVIVNRLSSEKNKTANKDNGCWEASLYCAVVHQSAFPTIDYHENTKVVLDCRRFSVRIAYDVWHAMSLGGRFSCLAHDATVGTMEPGPTR